MKRPPNKKVVVGALVLLVAASALASKPESHAVAKEVTFLKAN